MLTIPKKSIPMILIGMLLLFKTAASADDLALQFFREGQWELCQRELMRDALERPSDSTPQDRLLTLVCSIRQHKKEPTTLLPALAELAAQTDDVECAAKASFESAKIYQTTGEPALALDAYNASFCATTNRSLFLQSACTAFLLFEDNRSLRAGREAFIQQINSTRDLWTAQLFSICRHNHSHSWLRPSDWFIGFYRSQISPAIGQRCTLEPSCSEYFRRAAKRHNGLLAVPMVADRFVREPEVNTQKNFPVEKHGRIRYADPLHDHDFWMK